MLEEPVSYPLNRQELDILNQLILIHEQLDLIDDVDLDKKDNLLFIQGKSKIYDLITRLNMKKEDAGQGE